MLEVNALCAEVGTFRLDAITFSLADGEVAGLVGPNGAGKSTLFRTLVGLRRPTSGSARTGGGRITFIDENPPMFGGGTVAEHLRFIELAARLPRGLRSDPLVERFHLGPHLDKLPSQCSLGIKRKTALVMGLIRQAEVVLLDEPLNGLDPDAQRELRDVIAEASTEGRSAIVSSHWLPELERVAARYVVLRDGATVATGTRGELADRLGAAADSSLEDLYFAAVGEVDGQGR